MGEGGCSRGCACLHRLVRGEGVYSRPWAGLQLHPQRGSLHSSARPSGAAERSVMDGGASVGGPEAGLGGHAGPLNSIQLNYIKLNKNKIN